MKNFLPLARYALLCLALSLVPVSSGAIVVTNVGLLVFAPTNVLPPIQGEYVSPDQWHQLYANGIIVSNASHERFLGPGLQPPPPAGGSNVHTFNSTARFQIAQAVGMPFQQVAAPATVSVGVAHLVTTGGSSLYQTEMHSFDIQGGGLPPGVMIRESPTLASLGNTTVEQAPGGFLIASFFDIFTEISLDSGATWSPSTSPVRVELRNSIGAPAVVEPSDLLPPPNDHYVSPQEWHAQFAAGVYIKDVSHSSFLQSHPPVTGGTNIHNFGSTVDMKISLDGGATYQAVRATAPVVVSVADAGSGYFDTEMLALQLNSADLPPNVRLRESPTLPSLGRTRVDPQPDGTFAISSFFDIFTELSLDSGATWSPATNGPVRVELQSKAPEKPFTSPNLPPPGQYVSPSDWHAYFAMGIVISNVSHLDFLQTQPPPPPGGSQTHSFGSAVQMLVSMDGGNTFTPVTAPANVTAQVSSTTKDTGTTRFFDTEMLQLSIQGGGLPGGLMVRESPTRASTGRTSIRQAAPGDIRISSFFDIFTEISLDGGASWHPSISGPASVHLETLGASPVSVACPADQTVTATGGTGAAVSYPAPVAGGGCAPVTVVCNPPSGSTFPVGTTPVTCTASDTCGGVANCTFNVSVVAPVGTEVFSPTNTLPPLNGQYVSPADWHQLYANGIIISNASHSKFLSSDPPPPAGGNTVHNFGSAVSFDVSTDGGVTFQPVTAQASVTVQVTHAGVAGQHTHFDTEMLQLSISGGNLPPGLLVRESPTLPSPGHTTLRSAPGGYMIGSFFDIFTEISVDGGATWSPATQPVHVELRRDLATIPPSDQPTDLLPPPTGAYVSPADWHAAFAAGIIISNVSHIEFTQSQPPPASGTTNTHTFDSAVQLQLSTDGGATFQAARVPAAVTVSVSRFSGGVFDTEMLGLSLESGDLPPAMRLRESPTLPSKGGTRVTQKPDGSYSISSFFDIFTELSLDGGATWSPAQAPAHVELVTRAPEQPTATPDLPPLNGGYVSPEQWHQLYANGIIISNASHDRFTQSTPPPPPGGSTNHSFGSTVTFDLHQPGLPVVTVAAPANVGTHVSSLSQNGGTRYFETEMLQLDIQGGSLPGGLMVRESPTRASTGRTSVRTVPSDGTYRVGSFFDIFTELSTDGGATWSPAVSGPVTVHLEIPSNAPVSITCPPSMTVPAANATGAAVTYLDPTATGGCPPVLVVCNPPSGSTFPVGTTVVVCTVTDGCGGSAACDFSITVTPPPAPEVFFQNNGLPPTNGMYISPALYHQLYANGIIVRDIKHARFTGNLPPPPPGPGQNHMFDSQVEMEVSTDGGLSYVKHSAPAAVMTHVMHGPGSEPFTNILATEMLQLNIGGGTLPPGVMIRESPTLQSAGQTTIRPVPGGHMIGSFFDIFTELSLDGGATWSPAAQGTRVELRKDPALATPQEVPNDRLPPKQGAYVSPAEWHQAYAMGIVISNISHAGFTDNLPVPPPGASQTHQFDSHVDVLISQNGGQTFQPARVNAQVSVELRSLSSSEGSGVFDTEMLALNLGGGDLPPGVFIRESPTLPSRGGVQMAQNPDGTFQVSSFFDIFTEISLDGGTSWTPASNGAARVELRQTPEETFPTPNLPSPNGQYVSPDEWHAAFANGIIISNVSHQRFLESFPPPPPGGTNTHGFGSTVNLQLSLDGGTTFTPVSVPASVNVRVASTGDEGGMHLFDTEMLGLSLTGGGLPPGVMIRESPTRTSTGRTSIRQPAGSTNYRISSFFDIFLESSLDGGQTWSPSVTGPSQVSLDNLPANPCVGPASLQITRSADGSTVTITWTGGGFRLQSTTALSGSTTTVWTDVPGASGVTLAVQPGVNKFYRLICP